MNTEIENLNELDNDKYVSQIETIKNKKIKDKEIEKEQKNDKRKLLLEIQQEKLANIKKDKLEKKVNENENENYTELYGKSKLENLNIIKQYQLLFTEQLADFKYKKSSTNDHFN